MFVFGENLFQPYYRLDDQRPLAGEGRVMDQSDSRDRIPPDPVIRKKATGGAKHTTGERFNEGFEEWEHGQWPHVFKMVTDKKKGLKPDNESYLVLGMQMRCSTR